MSLDDLRTLANLSETIFRAEQARLHEVLAEEIRLRNALRHLEDRRRAARALPDDDLAAHRSFGGDVLWQGWIGRSRSDLQIRLAQVLARKGAKMRALRQAYGRSRATADLLSDAVNARDARLRKHQFESVNALTISRTHR